MRAGVPREESRGAAPLSARGSLPRQEGSRAAAVPSLRAHVRKRTRRIGARAAFPCGGQRWARRGTAPGRAEPRRPPLFVSGSIIRAPSAARSNAGCPHVGTALRTQRAAPLPRRNGDLYLPLRRRDLESIATCAGSSCVCSRKSLPYLV